MNLQPSSAQPAPVINQVFEPAWVRNGSPATKQSYAAALSFEEALVQQLSQTLVQSSGLGGEQSSESGEEQATGGPASGELSSLLPQSLTEGVMSTGGLGLAAELVKPPPGTGAQTSLGASGGASS